MYHRKFDEPQELEDLSDFIEIAMCVDKDSLLVLLPFASILVF